MIRPSGGRGPEFDSRLSPFVGVCLVVFGCVLGVCLVVFGCVFFSFPPFLLPSSFPSFPSSLSFSLPSLPSLPFPPLPFLPLLFPLLLLLPPPSFFAPPSPFALPSLPSLPSLRLPLLLPFLPSSSCFSSFSVSSPLLLCLGLMCVIPRTPISTYLPSPIASYWLVCVCVCLCLVVFAFLLLPFFPSSPSLLFPPCPPSAPFPAFPSPPFSSHLPLRFPLSLSSLRLSPI